MAWNWPYYFGYPYGFDYGYGYGYGSYGMGYSGDAGALDLNIKPKRTKVYLDGRYVGTTDQFDGFPSYLWVGEGTHELIFYLDGHETVRKEYSVARNSVQRDRFYMDKGVPIAPKELSTVKLPVTAKREMKKSDRPKAQRRYNYKESKPKAELIPASEPEPLQKDMDLRNEPGRLTFAIQPLDASVYMDGEFLGTAEDLGSQKGDYLVDLGDHNLEIVRPGYESKKLVFVVKKGETINLKIDLNKE